MPEQRVGKGGIDLDQIVADTFVKQVHYHETIDSTNDAALCDCQQKDLQTPLLVLASEQVSGRGRGSSRWWSAPGALTFSLVIRAVELGLSERSWPKASLTTGFAVCIAIEKLLSSEDVRLKWPNDVYVNGRKICGVLIEVGPKWTQTLVIGIGVNVNNSFQTAPQQLQSTVTSLVDVTSGEVSLTDVLIDVLLELELQLNRLARNDAELPADWRKRCMLDGQTVEVDTGTRKRIGICRGIDADGALVLLTDEGERQIFSGTVARVGNA